MKGSNGVRFTTAIIILFISLLGFGYSLQYFNCVLAKAKIIRRNEVFGASIVCGKLPGTDWLLDAEETMQKGISIVVGTIILDGIVIGVYQFFGKSKENREPVEKAESKKTA